jgi:hypothetical protein
VVGRIYFALDLGGILMKGLSVKGVLLLLGLSMLVWLGCMGVMYASMNLFSLGVALVIHAMAAPVIAVVVARFYYTHFHFASPLVTSVFVTVVVILLDVLVVALLIEGSLAIFGSILGTWIPFALIFSATYLVGRRIGTREKALAALS